MFYFSYTNRNNQLFDSIGLNIVVFQSGFSQKASQQIDDINTAPCNSDHHKSNHLINYNDQNQNNHFYHLYGCTHIQAIFAVMAPKLLNFGSGVRMDGESS